MNLWSRAHKPRKKIVSFEKYKPKSLFYFLTIIAFCIIRLAPISCGASAADDAINDFAIGVIASTWVAWLIEAADCKRRNKERKEKGRMIFSGYVDSVLNLRFFASKVTTLMKVSSEARTFKEWLDIIADINNYYCVSPVDRRKRYYKCVEKKVESIRLSALTLNQQYALLVESDIIDTDDFRQHLTMQIELCINICDCLALKDYSESAFIEVNSLLEKLVDGCAIFFPDYFAEKYTWADAKG